MLNLVYWTVGNPEPRDRSLDAAATSTTCSAIRSSRSIRIPGQRKWHYQFTPNDGHDWDSCQDVMLVDRVWRGQMRKLLLHADRNGMFYVLDRTNGAFLSATPFVYQNWNTGFDANGRPRVVPGSNSSREGSFFVYPTLGGGTNFQAPSYSPLTSLFYLQYREGGQGYVSAEQTFEAGRQYIGRSDGDAVRRTRNPDEPSPSAGIKALDPETGKTIWDFKIFQSSFDDRRAGHRRKRRLWRRSRRQHRCARRADRERTSGTSRPARTWPRRR